MTEEKVLTPEEQTIKALRDARALITDQDRWIRGALAESKLGNTCDPIGSNAYAFCSLGAIVHATGAWPGGKNKCSNSAYAALQGACGNDLVFSWNDASSTSHETVLATFDRAIEDLEMFA